MNSFVSAIYKKDLVSIEKLLSSGLDINLVDKDGRSALIHAILDSEPSEMVIKCLIENGIDVNIQDKSMRWGALHFAARDNKKDIVKLLLDNKAVVDLLDAHGNTPLWRAVMSFNGDESSICELLKFGANPEKENNSGISPRKLAQRMGITIHSNGFVN